MGYMLDNTMLRLTWSTGNDGGAVRTFTLPEPDRIDYREHLATLEAEGEGRAMAHHAQAYESPRRNAPGNADRFRAVCPDCKWHSWGYVAIWAAQDMADWHNENESE